MKAKLFAGALALMLCMGAFLIPVTAYAASDTKPPALTAWLNGDTLHIEASDDDSGVEAIYIDSRRFNYLVDGVIEIKAKDANDGNEKINIYAIDFAGNKSASVEITNPHYTAPAASSAPSTSSGTTPAPNLTQTPASSSSSAASQPSSSSQSSSSTPVSSSSTPAASSEPTSSAVPDSSDASGENPFTPDGAATVTDNATEEDGKEFYTVTTAEGNVFYIVIDRQRGTENVYLLNAVTEQDLMQLAAEGDGTSQSAIPTPEPTPTETPSTSEPEPTPDPEPEPEPSGGGNTGTMIFVVLALTVVGGAGYYFKIYKPKQQAADVVEDDFYDEDDEMEYEDDPDEYRDYPEESGYEYPNSEYDAGEDAPYIPDNEE